MFMSPGKDIGTHSCVHKGWDSYNLGDQRLHRRRFAVLSGRFRRADCRAGEDSAALLLGGLS